MTFAILTTRDLIGDSDKFINVWGHEFDADIEVDFKKFQNTIDIVALEIKNISICVNTTFFKLDADNVKLNESFMKAVTKNVEEIAYQFAEQSLDWTICTEED